MHIYVALLQLSDICKLEDYSADKAFCLPQFDVKCSPSKTTTRKLCAARRSRDGARNATRVMCLCSC